MSAEGELRSPSAAPRCPYCKFSDKRKTPPRPRCRAALPARGSLRFELRSDRRRDAPARGTYRDRREETKGAPFHGTPSCLFVFSRSPYMASFASDLLHRRKATEFFCSVIHSRDRNASLGGESAHLLRRAPFFPFFAHTVPPIHIGSQQRRGIHEYSSLR